MPRKIIAVATLGGIRDVPIAAGCAAPADRRAVDRAPYLHDGAGWRPGPPAADARARHPPRRRRDHRDGLLREPPGTVTLVPTAALTNIALAVRKEPRIVERVAEVVLMGGAVAGGNWTAAAEFEHRHRPGGRAHRLRGAAGR